MPTEMAGVDYKCCVRFKYQGVPDFVYLCVNQPNRCQIDLKWFLKNSYFYCSTKKNTDSFETQAIDPSIASVPLVPVVASETAKKNVDLAGMMDMRKEDWAYHFFKQNEGTKMGKILPPSQCNKVDNVTFFGMVKGWWFDNKMGLSHTGTAPSFLRVMGDDVCLCPQCREGFEKENYKDDMCTCWKVHNMVFKCSVK